MSALFSRLFSSQVPRSGIIGRSIYDANGPLNQPAALRSVWEYIKLNHLQSRKGFIVPDDSLSKVLGKGEIASWEIPREIARFRLAQRAPRETAEALKSGKVYFPHL